VWSDEETAGGWTAVAAQARAVLVRDYWRDGDGLFSPRPRARWRVSGPTLGEPWHYWWQAHALEALLDGAERGDHAAATLVPQLVAGVTARSGGDVTANDYHDDLAWMGLATWRAARAGLVPVDVPLALADAVLVGHDQNHGGFRWRRGGAYRNVAASAPAALLLARTAAVAGDAGRLQIARHTAEWVHAVLVGDDGVVADGATHRGDGEAVNSSLWSYNVGAVAALDVELARHARHDSEARRLLHRAAGVVRAGTHAVRRPPGAAPGGGSVGEHGGVWRDEAGPGGREEAALFRGILARFATELVLADPDATGDVAEDLLVQAAAAAGARDPRGRVGTSWVGPASLHRSGPPPSLAAHLAGEATFEAAARVAGVADGGAS
jgi:predicted alpha-1,6-mannanase (GH76 family)